MKEKSLVELRQSIYAPYKLGVVVSPAVPGGTHHLVIPFYINWIEQYADVDCMRTVHICDAAETSAQNIVDHYQSEYGLKSFELADIRAMVDEQIELSAAVAC